MIEPRDGYRSYMASDTLTTAVVAWGVTVVGLIVLGGILAQSDRRAFMADCAADGRQEYECRAMWNGVTK